MKYVAYCIVLFCFSANAMNPVSEDLAKMEAGNAQQVPDRTHELREQCVRERIIRVPLPEECKQESTKSIVMSWIKDIVPRRTNRLAALDEITNDDQKIEDFLQSIPERKKDLVREILNYIIPAKRDDIYMQFQERAGKNLNKERMDALLLLLTKEMQDSSKLEKRALAIQARQLELAERSRITARRRAVFSGTVAVLSLIFNILQATEVI